MRGLLVAFEGIDGVGKTTQINTIKNNLQAIVFKFPDRGTRIGNILDANLKKTNVLNPRTEHLLQSANRAEKEPDIKKNLFEGNIVLLDRYLASGIAYTSAKNPFDFNLQTQNELFQWAKKADNHLIEPDLTFFFHTSHPYEKDTHELYETNEFQQKVAKNFHTLFKENEDKWILVSVDDFWKEPEKLSNFLTEKIEIKRKQVNESRSYFDENGETDKQTNG